MGRGGKEWFSRICVPFEAVSLRTLKDILRIWVLVSVQSVPVSEHTFQKVPEAIYLSWSSIWLLDTYKLFADWQRQCLRNCMWLVLHNKNLTEQIKNCPHLSKASMEEHKWKYHIPACWGPRQIYFIFCYTTCEQTNF